MQTIRVLEKTDKDGTLLLRLPLGKPEAEYEVVIVLQPKDGPPTTATPEDRGWPAGYFEATFGSITDETFTRPSQDEPPRADDSKQEPQPPRPDPWAVINALREELARSGREFPDSTPLIREDRDR